MIGNFAGLNEVAGFIAVLGIEYNNAFYPVAGEVPKKISLSPGISAGSTGREFII